MESLQGHLLVASDELIDPNFLRTVVLMVQHNEEGALGVILNRPSNTAINKVWAKVSETPCQSEQLLRHGGPCDGPLMAIHADQFLHEVELLPGVYFSTGPESLQRLVMRTDDPVRFFVGCAGWGAGQLEGELATGSWRTTPATPEHIFDVEGDLWEKVTGEIIGSKIISALNIRHVPDDPSMN